MADQLDSLRSRYERTGKPVPISFRAIYPALNARDRFTHLIHPYPAKVIPHIPAFFLDHLAGESTQVLDPFCGSGTVLLEAWVRGHYATGIDINPLARLITQTKLTPLSRTGLHQSAERLFYRIPRSSPDEVLAVVEECWPESNYWFSEKHRIGLARIVAAIAECRSRRLRRFFEVCLSAVARRVSYADPRISVPVKQNPLKYPKQHPLRFAAMERLRWVEQVSTKDAFVESVEANIKRVASLFQAFASRAMPDHHVADSLEHALESSCRTSVDMVITSPPYLGAQKYIRSSSLGLMWLGAKGHRSLASLQRGSIGREHMRAEEVDAVMRTSLDDTPLRNKINDIQEANPLRAALVKDYFLKMKDTIGRLVSILRPGSNLILVMGRNHVANQFFDTDAHLQRILIASGLDVKMKLIDDIPSRGLMTRRNRSAKVIPAEIVTWYQKAS